MVGICPPYDYCCLCGSIQQFVKLVTPATHFVTKTTRSTPRSDKIEQFGDRRDRDTVRQQGVRQRGCQSLG